jgi:membrane protein YqaA with SNARE-associated domain
VSREGTPAPAGDGRSLGLLVGRFLLGLGVVLGAVIIVGHAVRPQLEGLAREFVGRFGVWGMAAGTLVADGFHFPIPPQFYMLLAIASDVPDRLALAGIAAGSVMGGLCGFYAAGQLGKVGFVRRRIASPQVVSTLKGKLGAKGLVALSLTPVAFSWLIYLCGISRYSWRYALLLAALRLPKLVLYYWLVRLGWSL